MLYSAQTNGIPASNSGFGYVQALAPIWGSLHSGKMELGVLIWLDVKGNDSAQHVPTYMAVLFNPAKNILLLIKLFFFGETKVSMRKFIIFLPFLAGHVLLLMGEKNGKTISKVR